MKKIAPAISMVSARIAMVATAIYYAVSLSFLWLAAVQNDYEPIREALEVSEPIDQVPVWSIAIGIAVCAFTVAALCLAFWSLSQAMRTDKARNFNDLAKHLQRAAFGLSGFWLGYATMSAVLPRIVLWNASPAALAQIEWDPLDIHIIVLIIAVALFAIARAMHQAATISEENASFV